MRTILLPKARLLPLLVAWGVVPLYLAAVAVRIGLQGIEDPFDPLLLLGFGAFAAVGALLVAKRPRNLVGWIMAAIGLIVALAVTGEAYAEHVMATRGTPDALTVLGAWVQAWYWYLLLSLVLIFLPLLFPDGRLPSRRWIPVAAVPALATTSTVVLGALTDTLHVGRYRIENPIGIEGLAHVERLPFFGPLSLLLLVGILAAALSIVVRFRRSRRTERQQLKWLLYAVSLLPLLAIFDYAGAPDWVGNLTIGVVLVALPSSIGIAVLRYRLYDIDLVINRTLVYLALTVALAGVYVVGVLVLSRLLPGEGNDLVVAASTLAVAALFSPARRRIQAFVDRRFYRSRYDSRRTVEGFSARLRDQLDLSDLAAELQGVVAQTVQPAGVSVWLRSVEQ